METLIWYHPTKRPTGSTKALKLVPEKSGKVNVAKHDIGHIAFSCADGLGNTDGTPSPQYAFYITHLNNNVVGLLELTDARALSLRLKAWD